MAKIDTSEYQSFDQITARLDSIVDQVRDKNVSLEHSLQIKRRLMTLFQKVMSTSGSTYFSPKAR